MPTNDPVCDGSTPTPTPPPDGDDDDYVPPPPPVPVCLGPVTCGINAPLYNDGGCFADGWQACTDGYSCFYTQACNTCTATAPTNLSQSETPIDSGIWQLTWQKGTRGGQNSKQHLYLGIKRLKVNNGCPDGVGEGTGCLVKDENIPKLTQSYTVPALAKGTIYYYRIVNYKNSACEASSATQTFLTSCELLPSSASLTIGETTTLTTSVNDSSVIGKVKYDSLNTAVATATTPDTDFPYETIVEAFSLGPSTVTNEVMSGGAVICSDTSTVTVAAPGPWWQVVDSDVTTNGDIVSRIYSDTVPKTEFILKGLGGYPGVASYGLEKQAVFGNGSVSSKHWLANTTSTWLTARTYGYDYLRGLLPSDWWDNKTTITNSSVSGNYFSDQGLSFEGYKVFYHNGNLTIDDPQHMSDQRAILFVDGGDLTIRKQIQLTKGEGFFMAVVKGNILIDPAVTSLEGFYLADNEFRTGTKHNEALGIFDDQLHVRGSVAGLGGVTLQRDLGEAGNKTTPAEVFEYAPDLAFTYSSKLSVRRMRWKEVAP